jgi:hypothetical protein
VPTRYEQLRQAIANLAADGEEQVRFLDQLLSPVTDVSSAGAGGNDELASVFDDFFRAANDMVEHSELSQTEKQIIEPLDALLTKWSGQEYAVSGNVKPSLTIIDGSKFGPAPRPFWRSYLMKSGRSAGRTNVLVPPEPAIELMSASHP